MEKISTEENKSSIRLDKTYLELDEIFYTLQLPEPVKEPTVFIYNNKLAEQFNIDLNEKDIADYFSGNRIIPDTIPFAQAYAGHQFGHFTILGDGRAIILGEIRDKETLYDIQLKGSGRTPYSRAGDGRATLPTMIREYLISEAMYNLNIPTTRSLCVIQSKNRVNREVQEHGAVLTRIAQSHIRIGTFEYAAFVGIKPLRQLLDYTIARHYPEIQISHNPALAFLETVIKKQINLVVDWIRIGFIHGVMNTDNTTISGETIDFGPCAFINAYDDKAVYSSIDSFGRYSFGNQGNIIKWNMQKLAESLLPLFDEDINRAIEIATQAIDEFDALFNNAYIAMMNDKLGLIDKNQDNQQLINELLILMKKNKRDYTNTFFSLSNNENPFTQEEEMKWFLNWKARIKGHDEAQTQKKMQSVNPVIIPRNHLVEKAIRNKEELEKLLEALEHPYDYKNYNEEFQQPPESEIGYKTYCGT